MCTLTYVPNLRKERFIITDNRDEMVSRPATPPKLYEELGGRLFYPKDQRKGGTWMGASDQKRLIVLLNGAFTKYVRKPPYRKSRGVVVKELLAAKDLQSALDNYDFKGIEPFFSILFSWEEGCSITELVWDEKRAYLNQVDEKKPKVWSSALGYSSQEHRIKSNFFEAFLKKEAFQPTAGDLWDFHHIKDLETEGGFVINRGVIQTTSIFQVQIEKKLSFRYEDFVQDVKEKGTVDFSAQVR